MSEVTQAVDTQAATTIVQDQVEKKISGAEPEQKPLEAEAQAEQKPSETDDDFAHRMAILAKKERALTERKKELKDLEDRLKKLERLERLKDEDPEAFLQESGMTLDQIIKHTLEKNKTETPEEKIARIEKMLQDKEENEKRQKIENTVNTVKTQIRQTIDESEDFPLIKSLGEHELVYNVMEQYWEETKQMLPIEKAAELVENEFFEKVQSLKTIDKVKKLFAQAESTVQNKLEQSEIVQAQTNIVPEQVTQKTLTNKVVAPAQPVEPKRLLSREESIARIAKELEAKFAEKKRLKAMQA